MSNYDPIIIGIGPSGPALARRLVAAGLKVAIIECKLFGGTCVNTGCTPTGTLAASAYVAHVARRASDCGVRMEGAVNVDTKEGIDVRVDSKMISVEKQGNSIAAKIESTGRISQIAGTHMLVATGRRPNTDDLASTERVSPLRARVYRGG